MASLASVDRLNILYYGEMELPAAEKKLRIVMAGAFQDAVRKYYDTVRAIISDEKTDNRRKDILLAAAVVSLRKAYLGFFDKYYERYVSVIFQGGELYYGVGAWRNQHALDFAVWLTRTARDEPNIAFENSHSMTVTRTEINAMCNLAALDGAYRSGMRFKTWETFGDGKVRPSHKAVGGTRIPIDEPFTVGNSKLMFPNDTSLGADAEEIINCRCTLKFDRGTPLTNANNRGIMRVGSGRMERKKDRGKIEPMPKKQFRKIERAFKRMGGLIICNNEVDSFLSQQQAEGATLDGTTVLLTQNPGRAAVFEEMIHAAQYRRGENDGSNLSRILNEIDAQKRLLRNAKAYKLTQNEIEQTRRALALYEADLEKLKNKN